jgi:hypothetical protein
MNMATLRNLAIDSFRANGHVNIAHARRHHAHDYNRVLDLYGLCSKYGQNLMQFELPGPCCSLPSMAQVILCEIAFCIRH